MQPDTDNDEPPQIRQPNAYPFAWDLVDRHLAKIYSRAKKEHWDPEDIKWDSVNPADYDESQKTAMAYWWAELANFENNAAASFAKALVHVTENHFDNATQKVTATIVMDECRHDETCMRGCNRLCPKFLKGWKPRNTLEAKALRNIRWIYFNGGIYWEGYRSSYDKCWFPLIFTSFMMGEACASRLFNEKAKKTDHQAFREAFKHLAMDESRHPVYTWFVLEDAIPTLTEEEIMLVPKRLRHGFVYLSMILFEPPAEFWKLPADFMDVHRRMEETAAQAGLGVLSLEDKSAA